MAILTFIKREIVSEYAIMTKLNEQNTHERRETHKACKQYQATIQKT